MAPELITFKLEKKFLIEVDSISKGSGYSNRTDFIRSALRNKIDEIRLKNAMIKLSNFRGKSNKKTTNEQVHAVRDKVLQALIKKKGFK